MDACLYSTRNFIQDSFSLLLLFFVLDYFTFKSTTTTVSEMEMEMEEEGGKRYARRDRLLEIEAKVRNWWDKSGGIFKAQDSPSSPFDIRVSDQDMMIHDHLTLCIYNDISLLPNHPWPRSFRCNGVHTRLNSKQLRNFRTLRQAIEEFSADATRFSLADADVGDGINDVASLNYFVFNTANAAILRLTKQISWMEEVLNAESSFRTGPPSTYADRVFANEINIAVTMTEKNYNECMFRDALKTGFYNLQAARDEYRFSCGLLGDGGSGMNRDLLWRFMDVQTRLITPICPHYAEYVWKDLLKKDNFVVNAGWPMADSPDLTLKSANTYLQGLIVTMRKKLGSKKNGAHEVVENKPKLGLIYVNEQYDGWKEECLRILQSKFDSENRSFAPDMEILDALRNSTVGRGDNFKKILKLCMPFMKFKKDEAVVVGVQALDLKLPFGEIEVLQENLDLIRKQLGLETVEVLSISDDEAVSKAGQHIMLLNQNPPSPGNPTAIFMS